MRRANYGRGARSTGWDFGPHMAVNQAQGERDAVAGIAAVQPFTRIVHPVIASPRYTSAYRVLRRFKNAEGRQSELIGETSTLREALTIASTEQGAAAVIDRNGKQVHFNWQPEEVRS